MALASAAAWLCIALFFLMPPCETASTVDDIQRGNTSDVIGVRHGSDRTNEQSGYQLNSEASQAFLRLLFDKYGERSTTAAADGGESATGERTMTFEGFEHLLDSLGLGDIRIADHGINDHRWPSQDVAGASRDAGRFRKLHIHDELGRHQHGRRKNPASGVNEKTNGDTNAEKAEETGEKLEGNSHRRRRAINGPRLAGERQMSLMVSDTVVVLPKCMSAMEILHAYDLHHYTRHSDNTHAAGNGNGLDGHDSADIPDYISQEDFLAICPSIIYQLDERICQPDQNEQQASVTSSSPCGGDLDDDGRRKCATVGGGGSGGGEQEVNTTVPTEYDGELLVVFGVPAKIWGFAFLSIIIISLVGLVVVAIIPLMGDRRQRYFDGLLQLLIALAVGTLTGDALLHLLPHALAPHDSHDADDAESSSHDDDGADHDAKTVAMVTHGLAVLIGIYCFMFVERLLSISSRCRRRHNAHVTRQDPKRSLAISAIAQQVGQKLSSHEEKRLSTFIKISSGDETSADIRNRELVELLEVANDANGKDAECHVAPTDHGAGEDDDRNGAEVNVDEDRYHHHHHQDLGDNDGPVADEDDDGVHRHQHHGHSHGEVPSGVASVAWMVIMGDGLHNFTDGLAIGASFVGGGLAGGLGTTVAVFCHELPHELGDFAVLINAGMSVRQALFYNLVSSILSVIGMVLGVLVGNVGSASAWIFALTAGIFIYISLVDMIPQMTKQDGDYDESQQLATEVIYLVLHTAGIAGGLAIMTFIALFEDRIQWIAGGFGPLDDGQ